MAPVRNTICVALAAAVGLAVGCGTSKKDIRAAKTSGYKADFALVYGAALDAVRKLYPSLVENANAGVIKTSWHPVRVSTGQDDTPVQGQQAATGPNPFGQSRLARKQYFIRFRVHVIGGNPWRVRVVGQASEWDAGGVPVELKGGNEPHWLQGRIDALEVAIYRKLKKYAVKLETTAQTPVALPEVDEAEEARKADEADLAGLPPDAVRVIGMTLAAARSRNFDGLRGAMAPEFSWAVGAAPSADAALALWQADSQVLDELISVIKQGCRAGGEGAQVSCPPAYTEQPGYVGYRVGFSPDASGAWKMIFFVQGD